MVVLIVLLVAQTIVARRRGYRLGARVVVRCRRVICSRPYPGRVLQSCSLGLVEVSALPGRQALVADTPVKESDLTEEQRRAAHEATDVPVP